MLRQINMDTRPVDAYSYSSEQPVFIPSPTSSVTVEFEYNSAEIHQGNIKDKLIEDIKSWQYGMTPTEESSPLKQLDLNIQEVLDIVK